MKNLRLILCCAICLFGTCSIMAQDADLKKLEADWDAETKAAKFKDGKAQFEILHVSFSADESETPATTLTSHHEDFIISLKDKDGNSKMAHYFHWMLAGKGKLKLHIVKSEGGIAAAKEIILSYRYDEKNDKLFLISSDHREYAYVKVGGH